MKKCGLRRAFSMGGIPAATQLAQMKSEDDLLRSFGITDEFRNNQQATLQAQADDIGMRKGLSARQKAGAIGQLAEQAGTFGTKIDTGMMPSGLSARQQMRTDMTLADADRRSDSFDLIRRQKISDTFGYQQGKSNDPAQDSLAKAAALRAEMEAKYGGNVAAAGKPQETPKPAAPQPSDADIVKQELGDRPRYIRRVFAHGGTPARAPFVDERGVIHGPEGTAKNPDKVKAKVKETGEPIMVGNRERIVNPEQAEVLDEHFASLGMTTDEFFEKATGEPVGPTLQRGLRHAANGGMIGAPVEDLPLRHPAGPLPPEMMRNPAIKKTAAGAAQNFGRSPEFTNHVMRTAAEDAAAGRLPSQQAASKVLNASAVPAPANLVEPMTFSEPAPAARTGIAGQWDKAKNFVGDKFAAAKNVVSNASAAETHPGPPKWYQPSAGVRSLARIGPAVASGAERLAAPVALLAGAHTAGQGIQHQNTRDAEEIDSRGGFLASSFKDAFPALATVGEKLGNDLGRVAAAAQGLRNPHTMKHESVWEALTSTNPAGQGETAADIYRRNTGAGSMSETAEAKAARAKAEADAKAAEAAKEAEAAKAKAAQDAASPLRDPTTNKLADETNANVRSLRSTGVRGDLGGDITVDGKTGARGIRTIQTMNGNVYAGRDKNGQLQVVSGLDRSPEDNEAMRAKEAARMTADLTRQSRAFSDMAIASDLKSNSREDNRRGLMALAQRQMQEDSHNKGLDRLLTQRGQDITLRGHELEYGAKAAALQNQMQQQQAERVGKYIENVFGPSMIKGKNGDEPNARRHELEDALTRTLGEANRHIGQLTPKDLQEFMTAYDAAKDAEPGIASKIYRKWIDGRPWVEDYNPHRTIARAAGPEGQTSALGMYQNPNGAQVWQPAVVGQQFLTGEYSGPRMRLINQ